MVKPPTQSSRAVQELVASVKSNVEVIRDALKPPATEDSHAVVSELMLELKQSQDKLQKKATELAESGQFDNTNEIFEAIDLVTQLEPEYESWSKPGATPEDMIGSNIHVDEPTLDKPKKKKKKKRKESAGITDDSAGGWEAFPVPPTASGATWPTTAPEVAGDDLSSRRPLTSVRFSEAGPDIVEPASSANGRITLGMNWETIGPLLGDPGSTDEERRNRLSEIIREALASECGISESRINIRRIS